jgi:RNA polymerase sigma-70 factor (ECF subfamily)
MDLFMTEHAHPADTHGLSPEALALLVQSHARFLAFLERRVDSRDVAEELLQEAFARAIARGDTLRDGESAVAWFYRLLRNALADHFRRRAALRRALDAAAREPSEPAAGPDAELMQAVCGCVHTLIPTLKREYADIVRAVDLEERSLADYAAEAGITSNNAGVRLHRAREALFRQVVLSCGTCSTHGCLDCRCEGAPQRA